MFDAFRRYAPLELSMTPASSFKILIYHHREENRSLRLLLQRTNFSRKPVILSREIITKLQFRSLSVQIMKCSSCKLLRWCRNIWCKFTVAICMSFANLSSIKTNQWRRCQKLSLSNLTIPCPHLHFWPRFSSRLSTMSFYLPNTFLKMSTTINRRFMRVMSKILWKSPILLHTQAKLPICTENESLDFDCFLFKRNFFTILISL